MLLEPPGDESLSFSVREGYRSVQRILSLP